MDEEDVVPIYNGMLAIKNEFELVLVMWMNLEPVLQSELIQKEENKYCILMCIYGIKKNGTDESTYREGMEM